MAGGDETAEGDCINTGFNYFFFLPLPFSRVLILIFIISLFSKLDNTHAILSTDVAAYFIVLL